MKRAADLLKRLPDAFDFEYASHDEIDTVEDAVLRFQRNKTPESVIMDIQSAYGLRFEVFQNIKIKAPIIFIIAFDQYAIQQFKVNNVDYVLKPIRRNNRKKVLEKLKNSNTRSSIYPIVLKQLLVNIQKSIKREGIFPKNTSGF